MKLRINDPQDPQDPPEPREPPEPTPAPPPPPPAGSTIIGTNGNDGLFGTGYADQIYGLDGHDTLYGWGGNDRLYGGAGSDWLDGGTGADVLDGGDGEDTVSYVNSLSTWGVSVDLVRGTGLSGDAQGDTYFGIEHIVGSNHVDALAGNAGNNNLWGGGGNDSLYGRAGNDHLLGEDGNDILEGGAGADMLNGGVGEDTVVYVASSAGVTVNLATGSSAGGEAQGDTYFSIENVDGSNYADTLIGNAGDNRLWGDGGNDSLFGGAGNDQLSGGDGDDALRGGSGADYLSGGAGQDGVYYQDSSAGVTVYLTGGLVYGTDAEGFGGDAEGDSYFGIENVVGSSHADYIVGTAGSNDLIGLGGADYLEGLDGNDRLLGGEGDDELVGGAGADRLDGGNGSDLVSYWTSSAGVTINLATGAGSGGDAQGDTYFGIENVYGSAFNDFIVGDAGNNVLAGGGGNDTVIGGAGQDTLRASSGHDIFTGDGNGVVAADTFVIGRAGWHGNGYATVTDFQQGVDKIDILKAHHYGNNGHLTLQDFGSDGELAWGTIGDTHALDAGDRYFFDTTSDTLYECDFSTGTLVLGDALVTINSDVARLQTSDFVLV